MAPEPSTTEFQREWVNFTSAVARRAVAMAGSQRRRLLSQVRLLPQEQRSSGLLFTENGITLGEFCTYAQVLSDAIGRPREPRLCAAEESGRGHANAT